jgi:glycosyltransferase involved in cell wall biosynthesis
MAAVVFVVPGPLDTLTGGSIYDRRIVEGLRARGWRVDVRELSGHFPQPSSDALADAAAVFASLPDGTTTIVDGLAFGALPDIAERESARLRLVAVVHLPLALEAGLDAEIARQLETREKRALGAADAVIVTGRSTADVLRTYGVSADRIRLVEPGTDRARLARGSGGPRVRVLSVATISPGKGHESLIRALASIDVDEWTLTCVGDTSRYPSTVARVRDAIRAAGLDDRITLTGELRGSDLEEQYAHADLFALATLRETYGMAIAEAIARGLPVVSTATGSVREIIGHHAGILVPPGDERALAGALARVLTDPALRAHLAAAARTARERLQTWDDAIAKMATALDRVPAHG